VVFIPKYRRRTLYEELRKHLGEVFRRLAAQKQSRIEKGHLMSDHVHMMISIPPKYAVSQGDWVYQGQERDPPGPGIRGEEAKSVPSGLILNRHRLRNSAEDRARAKGPTASTPVVPGECMADKSP
jgi:hypothetical protein